MSEPLTEAVGATQAAPVVHAWEAVDDTWVMPVDWMQRGRRIAFRVLPALAVAGGIVAFALSAHPKPAVPVPAPPVAAAPTKTPAEQDALYISLITAAGWDTHDRLGAIANGHYVCGYLEAGGTPAGAVGEFDSTPSTTASTATEQHAWDEDQVNAAVQAYCPQYEGAKA